MIDYHWSVPFKFTPHYWLGRGLRHVSDEVSELYPERLRLPELPDWEIDIDRQALGIGMMAFGGAILVPGPFDVAVAAGGAYLGGPAGAGAAVALYNITGVGLVVGGYIISNS